MSADHASVATCTPDLTPRARVATGRAATRQELQDYLGAHKIQERLNDWLNEMVKERLMLAGGLRRTGR